MPAHRSTPRQPQPARRPLTALLSLLLAALLTAVLTACAGSTAGSTAGSGSGAAGSSDLSRVTLTVGSPCKACLKRLLIASGQDKNTPYRINWADFDSTPTLVEAMKAGKVDVSQGGETGVLFALGNGADLKLLGAVSQYRSGGTVVLVKKGSPITDLAGLRGKKVAVPFYTAQHYQFARSLEAAGLKWSDVNAVNLTTTDGLAAFNSGDVSAFVIWDPNAAVAELHHDARIIQELGSVLPTYSALYATAAATTDPGKRAALEDLARRSVRAFAWVNSHRTQWAQELSGLAQIPLDSAQLAADRSEAQLGPADAEVRASWQAEIEYFRGQNQIKQSYPIADRIVPGFDAVIADELAKNGGRPSPTGTAPGTAPGTPAAAPAGTPTGSHS
ncbi:ABC transporter substrate-binding protein [Kitasatospora sp. NBC_01560]|uniref:ABC transporter substrate-binding protein n=1 Tax=Kitasatospora sp. NBC_01560 TaxID=2975965 RepID=UPI0038667C87